MNVAYLLDVVASTVPERGALCDERTTRTYASLADRARRWAAWLDGHAAGRAVVYLGTSRVEAVEVLFGCAVAGVPFVPVNYRLRPAELAGCVAAADTRLALLEERYRSVLPAVPGVASVDVERVELAPSAREVDGVAAPAVCLFTSGTTSAPKLAILTHENLSSYVLNTVEAASSAEDEAVLVSTPTYHIAWVANVLSNVYRARRIVLRGAFDPEDWLRTIASEGVVHAMVVPTMLARILDVVETRPDLVPGRLRTLAYGGARPPDGLVERALRLLPESVGLVNAFGLTETSSTVAVLGPEDHRRAFASADPAQRARLRSVGRAVPGVEIHVVLEDGTEAPAGEVGRLWVRGAQVSPGYVGRASGVDADGWLRTTDCAYVDEGGYVFVVGRVDDVIIRGGENIDPVEIEDVLRAHPAVTDAAVVGLDDAEWGQIVVAAVTGDRDASEPELREWVRSRLAGFKVPARIRWVGELPRTDTGKLIRRDVRSMMREGLTEVAR